MKFVLDVPLLEMINADRPGGTGDDPFVRAMLAIPGVASVFGVHDFVTVTRRTGADWASIVGGVQAAAEHYLPDAAPAMASHVPDKVELARQLLREAISRPAPTKPTKVSIRRSHQQQPNEGA